MKKKLPVLLVVLILLCSISVSALAEEWTCPDCGAVNTGNFCSNCGLKKPAAGAWTCKNCGTVNTGNFCTNCGEKVPASTAPSAGAISNIRFKALDNGDVQVTWDDAAKAGSYTVTYTTDDWPNYSVEMDDTYSNRTAVLQYLIPGVTYHVTVSGGASSATADYTVPLGRFTDWSTNKILEISETSFILNQNTNKPLTVTIYFPRLSKDRIYSVKLALKTPYGYTSEVKYYPAMKFETRFYGMQDTLNLEEYLPVFRDNFGEVPIGNYTFEIYFDGQLYATASFHLAT